MANVDDFWRQLNAKKANKASLSGLRDIPGLTTYSRTLPPKSENGAATATIVAEALPATTQVAAELPDQQGLQVHTTVFQSAKVTSLRQFVLQASIQRDVNCLKDQDRSLRRNAVSHAAAAHRYVACETAFEQQ